MNDDTGVCMMCGSNEHITASETDQVNYLSDGDYWVYCEKCDCWTAHPPEPIQEPKLGIASYQERLENGDADE